LTQAFVSVIVMEVECLMAGSAGSNCFVVTGGKVVVIDPGLNPRAVLDATRELHIVDLVFINTHCHFDHCGCVPELRRRLGGKYLIHELDAPVVERGLDEFMLAGLFGEEPFRMEVSRRLKEGDVVELSECRLEVLHTPGHTPGSICLYEPESKSLFTGDTLFSDGVGRTDFPGGSVEDLKRSLEKLIRLHEKRGVEKIYPGHGPVGSGDDISEVYEMYF